MNGPGFDPGGPLAPPAAPAPASFPPDRWRALRPGRWKSVALALAILLSGVVVGAGGAVTLLHRRTLNAVDRPERARAMMIKRLERRLGLTDAQTAAVAEIVNRRMDGYESIRAEHRGRLEAELEAMRGEVAAVLTAKQAEKWDRQVDRIERLLPPRRQGPK